MKLQKLQTNSFRITLPMIAPTQRGKRLIHTKHDKCSPTPRLKYLCTLAGNGNLMQWSPIATICIQYCQWSSVKNLYWSMQTFRNGSKHVAWCQWIVQAVCYHVSKMYPTKRIQYSMHMVLLLFAFLLQYSCLYMTASWDLFTHS